jgi:hypothetical protein
MADVLGSAMATAALACLGTALAIRRERREAARYGALPCPACGRPFGPGGYSTWHEHASTGWRCRWMSGPYLRCGSCGQGFRYTRAGELHPEQFEGCTFAEPGATPGRGDT